ncbi:uncharacterized protein LOC143918873 [Arctopsyche grandis]|uniref:uncharacterized protein LOC143918873 n=1 Tax=Arctopsyche grandis TaxID=121162 RepID=UPI00406D9368
MVRVSFLIVAMLASVLATDIEPSLIPRQVVFNITSPLKIGDEVTVRILLTNDVKSFSINLVSEFRNGEQYHVNYQHRISHKSNAIHLNALVYGQWSQNSVDYKKSPLTPGESFQIKMNMGADGIHSLINNQATFFPHQIPISDINYIMIKDDHFDTQGSVESIQAIYFNYAN